MLSKHHPNFYGQISCRIKIYDTFFCQNTLLNQNIFNVFVKISSVIKTPEQRKAHWASFLCMQGCGGREENDRRNYFMINLHESSIPARSHTFVEIDHEIISTVILLPSADSFNEGCCKLQDKVCAQITG